jgi:hypothetical protein
MNPYSIKGSAYSYKTNRMRSVDGSWSSTPEGAVQSLLKSFLKSGQMNDLLTSFYLVKRSDKYEPTALQDKHMEYYVKVEVENLSEILKESGFRTRTKVASDG